MTAKRRPFRFFFWLLGLGVLLASAVGAGVVLKPSRADDAPSSPDTPPAGAEVVCIGYVDVPNGVTPLYPVRPGEVVEVRAKANRTYQKGDVLLVVDPEDAQAQLREAEADLAAALEQLAQAEKIPGQERDDKIKQQKLAIKAAEGQLASAEARLKYAKSQQKKGLLKEDLLAAQQGLTNQARAVVQAEKAKLNELKHLDVDARARLARKKVEAKKVALQRARLALAKCELHAPFAGKVLRVLVSQGETLGSNPQQPALWICPTSEERIVRAEVDQEFAARVRVDQPATIEDDTRVSKQWYGKVRRMSDWYTHRRSILLEPLQYNDVRTLECIVTVDKAGQRELRIGQRVRVTIGRGK
jgi:multidrug resistance efflux pump